MVPSPIQTNTGHSLGVTFGCDYTEVRPVLERVIEFLRDHHLTEDELMGCELALAEGCNNAIRYAGKSGLRHRIELCCYCNATQVMFWIHDHSEGFDWPEVVNLPPDDSESGRGLYLMTSLMTDVHYFRGRNQNILYLSKKRTAMSAVGVEVDPESPAELKRRLAEGDQIITDMAEELSFCYESLAAIFRHSAEQGKGTTKAEFARRLLNDLIQIIAADWYVLRLLPEHGNCLNFVVASESLFSEHPILLSEELPKPHPVEVEAVYARQNVWFDPSRPLASNDPLGRVKPGANGVVHPFFFGDRLMGTLVLGRNLSRTPFTAGQLNVVGTFSDFLAIQFVNAEIQESLISSRLTERELEIARTIQQSLLLHELPPVPGLELVSHCESARQVGGDFFDMMECGDSEILIVIADVMGKGVPAAMFAAILRSLIRGLPRAGQSPAALLDKANRLLYRELSSVDMFITAQLVLINHRDRTVRIGNAGHCPAFIVTADGESVQQLAPDGMPLGVLPEVSYSDAVASLEQGGRIMVYTDGLVETRNPEGEQFGLERLSRWLAEGVRDKIPAHIQRTDIIEKLVGFQKEDVLQDDLTFLIISG